jgi:membrane associated rhomboid family serine protease
MQNDRNFIQDIKYRYQFGGMYMKLLFVNAAVFILIGLLRVISHLAGPMTEMPVMDLLHDLFTLDASFRGLLLKPWGLFTSMFAHFDFIHFLVNMLFLFMAGRALEQFFGPKRLFYIYLTGGIIGGIFEVLAHELIPVMATQQVVVVGASGAIMAIFMALAFYRPNMTVMLFGLIAVPIILLAGIFLLSNFLDLGANDNTAHFAHIGGALLGIVAAQHPQSSRNLIAVIEKYLDRFWKKLQHIFRPKPKLTVSKGGVKKTDYEYNEEKKLRQQKTDAILDKISKSGYESLSKAEKEFLFNQSKHG